MDPSKPDPIPPPPPSPPPQAFHYAPLLPPHDDQNDAVPLLLHRHPRRRRLRRLSSLLCHLCVAVVLVSSALLAYVLWPSDPDLKIVRLKPTRIRIHTRPALLLDLTLQVTLRVHNADAYSLEYEGVDVVVGYRGQTMGHVRSDEGRVRAFGVSYVDAEMEMVGVEVLTEAFLALLGDLARGAVTFEAATEVTARLGLWLLSFPLKVKLSCGVLVNTKNQTIVRQKCYPG